MVFLSLRAVLDDESAVPDRGRLEQQIDGLVNPNSPYITGRETPIYAYNYEEGNPAKTPARLECDRASCWLDFEIGFEAVGFGRRSTTLTWELVAELIYPLSTAVPEGATMELGHR